MDLRLVLRLMWVYGGQDQLWLGFPGSCIPRNPGYRIAMEDGVSFDAGSIKIEPITVEKKYFGTRFYFTAHMDTIAYNMSVDIGFGDVVIPHSTTIDFPLLLSDIPSVNIQHILRNRYCREVPYDDRS